jgi:hypothetical protein
VFFGRKTKQKKNWFPLFFFRCIRLRYANSTRQNQETRTQSSPTE